MLKTMNYIKQIKHLTRSLMQYILHSWDAENKTLKILCDK